MAEIVFTGTLDSDNPNPEASARINEMTRPFAQMLMNLSEQEMFNVVGSVLLTYGLMYDKPKAAIRLMARTIIHRVPEALAQIKAAGFAGDGKTH
jgi:hypothetical protein